jgi:hypothetical protein
MFDAVERLEVFETIGSALAHNLAVARLPRIDR